MIVQLAIGFSALGYLQTDYDHYVVNEMTFVRTQATPPQTRFRLVFLLLCEDNYKPISG